MPDWLPVAYAICGIITFGGAALWELIESEELTLGDLFGSLLAGAFWPLLLGLIAIGAVLRADEIVLYRRKKEPLPDLPPGEEALLEPVITPYHRASDALLTPHKEPSK